MISQKPSSKKRIWRLKPRYQALVILILMILLSAMLVNAQTPPIQHNQLNLNGYECLDRWQKEKIETAFRENEACQLKIDEYTRPSQTPPIENKSYWVAVLLGFISGMVVNQQLHH